MPEVPDVRTSAGVVRGTIDHDVPAYLGIPYAAPPFDANRMRPPQPVNPWDGVRSAQEYGPTAPKFGYPAMYDDLLPDPDIPGDECLNLNVWTPDPTAQGLPVFVWIHGGSFLNGSGAVPVYRGSAFARDGVVCVTINYRLQAEGFLYTAGDEGDVANLGLLDQLAALQWVQDNIAAFGGDPARVTVGGESAGAMSVTTLLSMPQSAGLFRAAITQSGAAAHSITPELSLRVTSFIAAELGVEPTRDAIAALPREQVYGAAQKLVADVQTSGNVERWGSLILSLLPLAPTVDGTVLPQDPLTALRDGANAGVALLTGTNSEEFRLFLVAPGLISYIDEAAARAGTVAHGADGDAALTLYAEEGASPGDTFCAILTDWFFAIPAIRVAEARGDESSTWMYRFDHRSTARGGLLGAAHAVELPFVFDTLDTRDAELILGPGDWQEAADTMHAAWVRFIRDGDPGWALYRADTRTTMVFGPQTGPVDHPRAERYAFWDGIR